MGYRSSGNLTVDAMGKCQGYRAIYGSGIREQYHLNSIGEADDVGQTKLTQVCQE